ncbi:MAG: tRNA (cytosine(32)/uridine(32)-2'-O)-methyltransferase TrmJ [Gammaproteobacteria bacterium]|jgi:tRNA (cytidine32/uridine32-2'-O)-methyltransferase
MLENIRIILVNTSHPGNIGAAARAMKNMGLSRLYLVAPKEHPTFEAYSRAAGADDVLGDAVVTDSLADALNGCVWVAGTSARERAVQWPVYDPRECAGQCIEKSQQGDIAIVFGRERSGLTNEEVEMCNGLVHIPTNPEYNSLNVAAAVQVLSYEIRMALLSASSATSLKPKTQKEDIPATTDQLEGMYQHMYQMMEDIQFFGTTNPEVIMRRLKSLFNRAQISRREVAILRGIFSAAQQKKSGQANSS